MDASKITLTENDSRIRRQAIGGFIGKGLARSSPLLCLMLIVPDLVSVLLDTGLKNLGILAAAVAILIFLILALIIGRISTRGKAILEISSMLLTGGFSLLAGLQLQFGVSRENPLNITLICIVIFGSFFAAFANLTINPNRVNPHSGQVKFGSLWEGVGFIAPLVGLGLVYLITNSITYVFFGVGGIFLLLPSIWTIFNARVASETPDSPREIRRALAGRSLVRLFAWALILAMLSVGVFLEQQTTGLTWCILGFGGGSLLHQFLSQRKTLPASFLGLLGLITCFLFIYQNPIAISNEGMTVFLGVLAGFLFGAVERDLRTFPKKHRKNVGLWGILWFILIVGGLFLGQEFQYEIEHSQDLGWVFWVFGGACLFAFVIELYASKKWHIFTTTTQQQRGPKEIVAEMPLNINKRKILALSLCCLVVAPSMTVFLYLNSHSVVWIDLPTTMYTVDGTPVTRVELLAKSAKILLYSPHPTGIAHGETIRPRKSIRLGAYFYGMGDTTVADAIQWIGTNLDVYSLGMCGYVFSPENITAMRALNAQAKFYYMTYGTTLFENASATYPEGTYGNTQIAYVKFNDTMNGWTLKLKNGSEATGVRRGAESDAHLMDLGQLGWADYFAWIYTRRAADYHADGVAIDEIMWRGYWGTEISDLRDYTSLDQIIATCYAWLVRLDAQTDMEVITQAFWPAAQVHQNGTWGETSFRSGGQYGDRVDDRNATVWYESMTWQQIIEDMETQAAQNKSYIWAAWYERNNIEALEYAIASYLMAKPNNYTKLTFHPQPVYDGGYPANLAGYSIQTVQEEVAAHPEYFDLEMGDAIGPMFEVQGIGGTVWQRNFTNGIVLVNPNHAFLPGFE